MTSKDKISKALNFKQSKVPVDFGSTGVTGMHVSCIKELRQYYGLEDKPIKVTRIYTMTGEIEEDLKEVLGLDVDGINPLTNMFGFTNDNWKEWETPWGQTVLVPHNFNVCEESNDVLIYPQGDMKAPASGRMPKSSYFFDAIIRQKPIDLENLIIEENLEEFGPMGKNELDYIVSEIDHCLPAKRAIALSVGGLGLGNISQVPAVGLKNPKGIRDVAEWYMMTALDPEFIQGIFEKQTEIGIRNLETLYTHIGNKIDVLYTCGTDFGTQDSSFCSVETFNNLYLPYYKKVNDWIHKHTEWKIFKHSCGSIKKFIPSFIESGFDILNPVQCSARDMSPDSIKNEFGHKIVFWGGGVDTQRTLPYGRPSEIRDEVLQRCETFSKNGGFVFNSVHNIQAKTPVENIVSMFDAVREYNK